jgi:hypothetical protein
MEPEDSLLYSQDHPKTTGPCATFHNMADFLGSAGFRLHTTLSSWRIKPCRLSVTVYSMYYQLQTVPGAGPLDQ